MAQVAVCSEINTKHINTAWAERKILDYLICWGKRTEHVFKTQVFMQVNIQNLGAHKFRNLILVLM